MQVWLRGASKHEVSNQKLGHKAEVLFRLLYVVFGLRQVQAITRTFAEISLMRLADHAAPFGNGPLNTFLHVICHNRNNAFDGVVTRLKLYPFE